VLGCACLLWCGGCFTRKASTSRVTPVALARPIVPPKNAATLEPPPELHVEYAAKFPARLAPPRSGPARPHVAAAAPVEAAPVEQPEGPVIVPDLTPEELSAAQTETQHSLDMADASLAQLQGKKLSAAQADVESKIRGFIESAHDAMKNSDWQRAKNLAKKAEVLSRELVSNPQ
jgi:hypothetical protein